MREEILHKAICLHLATDLSQGFQVTMLETITLKLINHTGSIRNNPVMKNRTDQTRRWTIFITDRKYKSKQQSRIHILLEWWLSILIASIVWRLMAECIPAQGIIASIWKGQVNRSYLILIKSMKRLKRFWILSAKRKKRYQCIILGEQIKKCPIFHTLKELRRKVMNLMIKTTSSAPTICDKVVIFLTGWQIIKRK